MFKEKFDALLVSSVVNIAYLTGFGGFSKDEREAYLLIMTQPQGLTHKIPGVFGYLFTDGRYFEEVKKVVKNFEIVKIPSLNSFYRELKKMIKKEKIKRLGFEKNNLTVGELERFNGSNHFSKLVPTENIVENLRAIKDSSEIEAIQKACELTDKTFDYILEKIKPGISEKQLAFEIEFFIKKRDADISFPPIVAFGKNSAVPHHQTSNQRLAARQTGQPRSTAAASGQLILIDFGARIENYCSDMTRVVFWGKATKEQKRIYRIVVDAQKKALEHLGRWQAELLRSHDSSEVDLKAKEVDKVARSFIIKAGFKTMPHGLGHGVGLEVHELPRLSPRSKDILKPGMVFSLEPGIYLPASPRQGGPGEFGIRIEDSIVLEKSGPRILTQTPKEIIEL